LKDGKSEDYKKTEAKKMYVDVEKMEKAKIVLAKIAKGVNPVTGEMIDKESFLNDSKMVRCFNFTTEVLDKVMNEINYNKNRSKFERFIITPEQKSRVVLPEGKIGVSEFAKCINSHIDINHSKKLTGVELNKGLKKLGVLSEVNTGDGKTRTVVTPNSIKYGFETEKRSYNGVEYDKVVINENGKKYLLENIEKIMEIELEKTG
jgi:hypothetical protein